MGDGPGRRILGGHDGKFSPKPRLNSDEDSFRALLQRCPWGDPNATAMVPRHVCRDPLVAAHQHATKALVRLELAKTAWKLDRMEKMENVNGAKEIESWCMMTVLIDLAWFFDVCILDTSSMVFWALSYLCAPACFVILSDIFEKVSILL